MPVDKDGYRCDRPVVVIGILLMLVAPPGEAVKATSLIFGKTTSTAAPQEEVPNSASEDGTQLCKTYQSWTSRVRRPRAGRHSLGGGRAASHVHLISVTRGDLFP
ncbi:hypothetical protein EVAR_40183_1 [Eumeta japonica]|uniref:Uncharacterized protein n=1 Tax=Eumeta variegata TaxID=151549 RepID=A0A4C1XLQ1_EUMVA|nr:hypothetical protein EVAR_40183_1 [Eumeta japonica]